MIKIKEATQIIPGDVITMQEHHGLHYAVSEGTVIQQKKNKTAQNFNKKRHPLPGYWV